MKLIDAAIRNDLELVKKLICEGYPLNNKNNSEWTALMYAFWNGHIEITKELIKAGASLDTKNKHGTTAFNFHKEIWQSYEIQYLILSMCPDKYSLLEEKIGIHKDILLRLKMEQILGLY